MRPMAATSGWPMHYVCELSDAGRAELRRDRLGLVFQQFNLIPSLTVEDNLVFQSRIAGRHDAAWHA